MTRRTRLIDSLPPTVPFLAPEAIERRTGKPLVVRLGANESAFGVSPKALAAMREAAAQVAWYGDPESHELRAALAERHGIAAENLVIGCGIDDLLGNAVRLFVEPGDAVVASKGSYPTFAYHVAAFGGRLCTVPYKDDAHDLPALGALARENKAKILYLANPDNPTGSFATADAVAQLVASMPADCTLLLDEAYADFVATERLPPMDVSSPAVLRMRTFSKAHGMAGARIAYAIAARETMIAFDKFRHHFGVGRVSQAGALASLGDTEFLASVARGVAEGRREYALLAEELGLRALASDTNFVAFDFGEATRARAILAKLQERGVFVRVGVPPLDRLLRVTVGLPDQRVAFASALRAVLAEDR
jgi:histidinol-phosphate aminotransferase